MLAIPGPSNGHREGLLSRIVKLASGPQHREVAPRKGNQPAGIFPSPNIKGATPDRRPEPPNYFVPVQALRSMADRDDIIFAIRRTLRMAIGELEWHIVPDLDAVKADIKRWQTSVMVNLAIPDLHIPFEPHAMSNEIFLKANSYLRDMLMDIYKQSGAMNVRDFSDAVQRDNHVQDFFKNIVAAHDAIAQSHVPPVRALFEHPNPSAESSFRAFLSLLLDDVTLFDAGVIVKNPTPDGKGLGEIYCLPGEEIRIYQRRDLATPQPPYVAYDWSDNLKVKAYYNNDELVYVMANPQKNGYGKSPVSLLVELMAGAIYANANMMDELANKNLPFFVFDLGPNVSQPDKDAVEQAWDNKVVKGRYRGIFIGMKEGVKGFIPMPTPPDETESQLARLKYWANVKCAMYGLSLNDIGFTEDLHRTTAETQAELTQSRGINSFANIIEGYINGEIVKGRMWVRDNLDDPKCMEGKSVPCFPFKDVKFEFERSTPSERFEEGAQMIPFFPIGAVTLNEIRRELGLPPVPGGDVNVIQMSNPTRVDSLPNLPVESAEQQQAEMMANGQLPPGQNGEPQQPGQGSQEGQRALPPGQDAAQKGLGNIEALADELRKRLQEE